MVKIGDKLIVHGWSIRPTVVEVWYDETTDRTVIELDWGTFGTSHVYEHDENITWFIYNVVN